MKKTKLHLKKAQVFRGSGFEVSGGKSKQWIDGVASLGAGCQMKLSWYEFGAYSWCRKYQTHELFVYLFSTF